MKIRDYLMKKNTSQEKKYYLLYCRKSSEAEDRQMESIKDQLNICLDLAKTKNLPILKKFEESYSAKAPGRPIFNEMIELIKTRQDIQGIICWKLNRLFRNPVDEGVIRWFLQNGQVKEVVTPHKIYVQADSDFTMAVEGAQSQRFITDLRQDTWRGIKRKLDKGIAPILAPCGYQNNIAKRQGKRDITPHPIFFSLMRKVFEFALTGNYNLTQLCVRAQDLGIKNNHDRFMSKNHMYRVLTNPFYAGKFKYAGQLYQGTHQPMLTGNEFDLLQDILSGNHVRREHQEFPLSGLIRCGECGMMICGENHTKHYKNGQSQTFSYYRCTKKNTKIKCFQPYTQASELERQVIDYLGTIKLSSNFVDWAFKWLREANKGDGEVVKAHQKALEARLSETRNKINALIDLYVSPANKDRNLLTEEEFTAKKQEYLIQQTRFEEERSRTGVEHINDWTEFVSQTCHFASNAQELFANGGLEDKKIVLKAIGSNLILKDKKLEITPRTPFLLIQKSLSQNLENKWLEPEERVISIRQTEELQPSIPLWGG